MDKEKLKQFPYFTGKMLKGFLKKKYPSTTIVRWKNKITKIEKGKYTVQTNPLTYATIIITPSYTSFRTALHHYKLTNQIPIKIQIATTKRKKELKEIEFITINKKSMFGYKKYKIENLEFFIAEKEKLLLDCLQYPKAGVMPNELTELIKEPLEKEKIINYLKKINNLNLIKKTGFLLNKTGINIYKEFKKEIIENNNYPLLNPLLPKTEKTNKRWKININEEIEL
ncbi:hypothetical protein K8R33_01815 [archaeon]|nr:hypothetical protein [archaeon]